LAALPNQRHDPDGKILAGLPNRRLGLAGPSGFVTLYLTGAQSNLSVDMDVKGKAPGRRSPMFARQLDEFVK
jgi:hypothetical protein